MYISSVGKRIPSSGLMGYMLLLTAIFFGITLIGAERVQLSSLSIVDDQYWYRITGSLMVLGGIFGIFSISMVSFRFQRLHVLLLFLTIFSVISTVPIVSYLAGGYIIATGRTTEPILNNLYLGLFVGNILIISIVGVYIYLQHFKAFYKKPDMAV